MLPVHHMANRPSFQGYFAILSNLDAHFEFSAKLPYSPSYSMYLEKILSTRAILVKFFNEKVAPTARCLSYKYKEPMLIENIYNVKQYLSGYIF